ncbi:MAG: NAD-dependent epimerase/dehydratase family protein, partial [Flavobacteriaceae bacterium]
VIHCAGLVGGIQTNIEKPYSFLFSNTLMGLNLVNACVNQRIRKVINLGSSCMYPKDQTSNLNEEDILTGPLEPTNEGYAIAKITVSKLCEYAKREYKLDYKTIIPCNLYGKYDKFDPEKSHMIPAAIRKLHKAKTSKKTATIWGDGGARREFMYVEDLVDFISYALKNYNKIDHIMNVGLGYDFSIKEYYDAIAEVVGYNGDFEYDLTKPSGMKRKLCDVTKQKKIGWKPKNSLTEGLQKTYQYYLDTYEV